jgi:lipopolysaccharide transport system ATP-binding protein
MEPIIKVENLGKSYIIGHQRERYVALRDVLANKARQVVTKTKNILSGGQLIAGNELEEFWALKDINFEVQQGDRVGIIGRNGAGKSTLLKVLSRITEPTTGRIHLKGRVASLLEVGTGFHPELSGRENIYLNGAILGMSRAEVKKKFDEIVDFAGVEKFLDTPVKRYSSGMYVRLAFAVAAHLEPEILIVDEVLAVGDAEFQKKCLGKMEDVSKNEGRTVLFVSHNMGAIRTLCNHVMILNQGILIESSPTEIAINKYLSEGASNSFEYNAIKTGNVYISYACLLNEDNKATNSFDFEEIIRCKIIIKASELKSGTIFSVSVKNIYKNRLFSSEHLLDNIRTNINGHLEFIFEFPKLPYAPGIYSLLIAVHIPNIVILDIVDDLLQFEIIDKGSSLSKYEGFTGDLVVSGKIESH